MKPGKLPYDLGILFASLAVYVLSEIALCIAQWAECLAERRNLKVDSTEKVDDLAASHIQG
jgi:hypothetical protein